MSKDENDSAANYLPRVWTIDNLRKAAKKCHGCDLYKNATQTVFGDGSPQAQVVMVSEIAGAQEDETGKPFVGPAGKLLKQSIEEADLNPEEIYLTNVVKHFKFTYMNKRKLHRSPNMKEVKACIPWLKAEVEVIQPKVILCLGAIAAKTLIAKSFALKQQRGKWFEYPDNIQIMATFHPSAILRSIDKESRHQMRATLVRDIEKIAIFLKNN